MEGRGSRGERETMSTKRLVVVMCDVEDCKESVTMEYQEEDCQVALKGWHICFSQGPFKSQQTAICPNHGIRLKTVGSGNAL